MSDKYSLLFDKNAVSELVGYLILVSVAVTVIGIIYVMAMPQLSNSQDQAKFQSVEQAYTVLDTHMSKSQYSNDLSQTTEMKLNGGKLTVDKSDGSIQIWFKAVNPGDPDVKIYETNLGTIYYTLNGREVGYQGGGIWEGYPDGGSAMISAPDFNYNGETLTLPLMQIIDSGTKDESGTGTAFITARSQAAPVHIYPNTITIPMAQSNPVSADEVYVVIKSRYYQAWANYINSNTDAGAVVDPVQKTCTVTFFTHLNGQHKPFRPGEPIKIRGLNYNNPHPISAFYLDLNGAKSKLQVDLEAPKSDSPIPGTAPALKISFQKMQGSGQQGVTVTVTYTENNKVEIFQAPVQVLIDPVTEKATVDFLTAGIPTDYISPATDDSWTWVSENGMTYHKNDHGPDLDVVIEHYMRVMGEKYHGTFTLYKSNAGGGGGAGGQHWPDDTSTYVLDYDAHNVLTYMHITNNPITVTLG